jgi:hypothetical protein
MRHPSVLFRELSTVGDGRVVAEFEGKPFGIRGIGV